MLVGLVFLAFWWDALIYVIQGGVPLLVILGGLLATYLGYEEWKDSQSLPQPAGVPEDTEQYKEEAEKYKAELEALKKEDEKAAEEA